MRAKAYYRGGAEIEAQVGARAMVEFERRYDVFWADAFGGKGVKRVEHAFYLTWATLRYAGEAGVAEDFDEWLTDVIDAEVMADDPPNKSQKGNPTKRAPSRAAS